jgi:hypothetical protein
MFSEDSGDGFWRASWRNELKISVSWVRKRGRDGAGVDTAR